MVPLYGLWLANVLSGQTQLLINKAISEKIAQRIISLFVECVASKITIVTETESAVF